MSTTRKSYTEEFKRDAIALVDSSGKTVTAAARRCARRSSAPTSAVSRPGTVRAMPASRLRGASSAAGTGSRSGRSLEARRDSLVSVRSAGQTAAGAGPDAGLGPRVPRGGDGRADHLNGPGHSREVVLTSRDGLSRDCAVHLDHVQTVSRARIGPLLASLDSERMREVRAALLFALGF